ncbi:hypothetical protein [Clostridium thermarum]|nr:hypothetical protein [Clostridium thermarum]
MRKQFFLCKKVEKGISKGTFSNRNVYQLCLIFPYGDYMDARLGNIKL